MRMWTLMHQEIRTQTHGHEDSKGSTSACTSSVTDYEKTSDCTNTSSIKIYSKAGNRGSLLQLLEDVYDDETATVKLTCLEEIFKKLEWNGKGIKIGDEHLNNLKYVDNIVLFSESANELRQLIYDLNKESLDS
ncbi:uncharacterized protein [Penaeus vannamei]|uniref:uncharacterized protein n=1 Tax=Penaeus vannamei TaxID=6689 RepID=UPI00387FA3E0